MGFVELQDLYPSFDDKVDLIKRIAKTVKPALEDGAPFPTEIMDIVMPLIITKDPSRNSPQQIKFQKWWERKKDIIVVGAPPVVKVAAAAVEAMAYTTGQPGGDMYTPVIRDYEDSITWSPGGMIY
jgi:hypothetical protein